MRIHLVSARDLFACPAFDLDKGASIFKVLRHIIFFSESGLIKASKKAFQLRSLALSSVFKSITMEKSARTFFTLEQIFLEGSLDKNFRAIRSFLVRS